MKHRTNRSWVVSVALFAATMLLLLASSPLKADVFLQELGSSLVVRATALAFEPGNASDNGGVVLFEVPASFPFLMNASFPASSGGSTASGDSFMNVTRALDNGSVTQIVISGLATATATAGAAGGPGAHAGAFSSFGAEVVLPFSVIDEPTNFQIAGFINYNSPGKESEFLLETSSGGTIFNFEVLDVENLTIGQSGTLSPGSYFLELALAGNSGVSTNENSDQVPFAMAHYDLTLSFSDLPPDPCKTTPSDLAFRFKQKVITVSGLTARPGIDLSLHWALTDPAIGIRVESGVVDVDQFGHAFLLPDAPDGQYLLVMKIPGAETVRTSVLVRRGRISRVQSPPLCFGDVNLDGVVDALDIEPFIDCLFR